MMSMKQAVIFYYMPVCDTFHCNLSIKKIVPLQKKRSPPLSLSDVSFDGLSFYLPGKRLPRYL